MSVFAWVLLAQLGQNLPVLSFPEPGLDEPAAYQGYQTRLYRDGNRNVVQIYLDAREGRAVHVWANSENESVGFSARDARGRLARLNWGADRATSTLGSDLAYRVVAAGRRVELGHFLLGSMRVERDFQAWGHHRRSLRGRSRFVLPEVEAFFTALGRLPGATQERHLAHFGVRRIATLRARLHPVISLGRTDSTWFARVTQLALDGRDSLTLEFHVEPRDVTILRSGDAISLRAHAGNQFPFTVRITSSAPPLTPLERSDIFSPAFLEFLASARAEAGGGGPNADERARWLERHVRGVELLAAREKLMAGLPTYATYFGRDMLMSALMMRSIWREEVSQFVIASVLRKLSPTGQVSHEEALGGQAVREALAEYAQLVTRSRALARAGNRREADSLVSVAGDVLRRHRQVRENYHMIDDELQLPVLVARWLAAPSVSAQAKRAFLLESSGSVSHLVLLLRELALVARMTAPYAADPRPQNLISFAARGTGWASTSWRDSNAGYGGGRYAMDVNAIWAPHALYAMRGIFRTLRELRVPIDSLATAHAGIVTGPLARYARDSVALDSAIATWRGAERHFVMRLSAAEVSRDVGERLAAMPLVERTHWASVLSATGAAADSLEFLALALDANARPLGVANSDPATALFLGEPADSAAVLPPVRLRDVRLFVRPYPVGLFIERVGPVVANDAFATPAVWRAFERDAYHGPRVAWGREVNLFLLGSAQKMLALRQTLPPDSAQALVSELRNAVRRVQAAVAASGFHSELWSYEFQRGQPTPVRYGSGNDVQLWSTTALAVEYALWRLTR
jgi:hypothetical protein